MGSSAAWTAVQRVQVLDTPHTRRLKPQLLTPSHRGGKGGGALSRASTHPGPGPRRAHLRRGLGLGKLRRATAPAPLLRLGLQLRPGVQLAHQRPPAAAGLALGALPRQQPGPFPVLLDPSASACSSCSSCSGSGGAGRQRWRRPCGPALAYDLRAVDVLAGPRGHDLCNLWPRRWATLAAQGDAGSDDLGLMDKLDV
jgi:hypothetical protein